MTADPQENEKRLKLTRASDVRAKKVHFLVKGIIPIGTLTVLAGASGIGKTTILIHYLAALTRGLLDGKHKDEPRDVIILSPEDDEASITRPRLEAAGADLDRVHFMSATRRNANGETETYVSFPADIPLLVEAVKATEAAAIMIDPISSLIAGNLDKREDVRAAFDRLAAEIAKEYELAVLLVAHNKKGQASVREKVSGSAAITDAARSVLAVAPNEENDTVVMTVDKSSYSTSAGLSLEFKLTSVDVPIRPGEVTTVARADFLGESDVSVAELNARQSGEEIEEDDRNAAQSFLIDFLGGKSGGEAKANEVIKAGRANGFTENDLKNARKRCRSPKIATRRARGEAHGWVWGLEYETQEVTQGVKVSGAAHHDTLTPSLTPSPVKLAPVTPIGGDRS